MYRFYKVRRRRITIKSRKFPDTIIEQVYTDALSGSTHSKDNINDRNGRGYTALMLAVERENLHVLRALLEAGADLNVSRSSDGRYTALSLAIDKGHTTAVQELLQHGAFLSCEKGIEALDMARENGFLDAVVKGEEYLITQNREQDISGKTGVFQAFIHDRLDLLNDLIKAGSYVSLVHPSTYRVVKNKKLLLPHLIAAGVDINIVLKDETALLKALDLNSSECVEILIKSKCDVNVCNKYKMSPLHIAAHRHDIHAVKMLVEAGADINAKTCDGETPLHLAARRNNIDIVKYLVEAGGSVNSLDNNGKSVLLTACEVMEIDANMCFYLVEAGALVNVSDKDGDLPVANILKFGSSLDLMKLFIEQGADVNACDSNKNSILSVAIWRRQKEIAKYLVQNGADVNFMFHKCVPVLVMAVESGDVELVKIMLEKGADVTKSDMNGNTPLHAALRKNSHVEQLEILYPDNEAYKNIDCSEMVKVLIKAGSQINQLNNKLASPLHLAIKHKRCADILIEAKADVNITGRNNLTPLHLAAREQEEIVKMLIDAGANVNAENKKSSESDNIKNVEAFVIELQSTAARLDIWYWERDPDPIESLCDGSTPLHVATMSGDIRSMRRIISAGGSVDALDKDGDSALFKAIDGENIEKIKFLVETGANVNLPNRDGEVPIVKVLEFKNLELLKLLTEHGADVNACNLNRISLLSQALSKQNMDIACMLIQNGACVNVTFDGHVSVFIKAIQLMDVELVMLMLQYGADVTTCDSDGNTALHIALSLDTCNTFSATGHTYHGTSAMNASYCNFFGSSAHKPTRDYRQKSQPKVKGYLFGNSSFRPIAHVLNDNLSKIHKCFEIVNILINAGANVNQLNKNLESPLHIAIKNRDYVDLLIKADAYVNLKGKNKLTPLHLAASGEENIVKLLIHAGADVNAKTQLSDLTTGIDVFVGAGETDLIQLIDDKPFVINEVFPTDTHVTGTVTVPQLSRLGFRRSQHRSTKRAVELKKQKPFCYGETPLHIAAKSGNINSIKYLVSAGASVNALDKNGDSVLHKSIKSKNMENISYLVQAGANVNVPNKSEVMPIVDILDFASLELLQLFIEHGANVNSCDSLKNSVLSLALSKQRKDVANLLVENGADVNVLFNEDRPVLNMAVELGYFELTKRMLKLGADVTRTDLNGNTALHAALSVGRYEYSGETNLPTFNQFIYPDYYRNQSSLIQATPGVIDNNTDYREWYLDTSLDDTLYLSPYLMSRDKTDFDTGYTSLYQSNLQLSTNKRLDETDVVIDGRIELTETFIKSGLNINQVNQRLESPLHLAVNRKNHLSISPGYQTRSLEIQKLLKLGANVNIRDNQGKTALHYCIESIDFESVKILLEAGADVNLEDANFQTPLHVAVRLHRDVTRGNLNYLGDKKKMNEKLTQICFTLIPLAAQLNVSDKKGNTAMHYAVQSHTIDVVQRLLDAGADVTLRNTKGKTVLHKAAKNKCIDCMAIVSNHTEIVHVIDIKANKREMYTTLARQKGSNVSDFQASYIIRSSADAPTALMIAVKDQNTEVALMLLKHKADVNIRNDDGYSALHIAAEGSYTKTIEHLIQAGADVNDQTNDGETPLMLARDIEVIKKLCKAGADVNVKNKLGQNVLHKTICGYYLSETNRAYLIEHLVQYNIDINALDADHASVLFYCISRKQMNNVEFLLKAGANPLIDKNNKLLLSELLDLLTNETDINSTPELETIFSKGHFEYLRLLVCNGIILKCKKLKKIFKKYVQLTSLLLSILYRRVDVAKYLLTTGYVTVNDLRLLRQFDKSPQELSYLRIGKRKQHVSSTAKIQTLIHEAVSRPWPLVKLAFVTVSTMLGTSPEREERLSHINLPDKLKQLLMFQTPEAQLPVSDWSKCPLFFNPIFDEAGSEYSLHSWPIDLLLERMKYRLEQLQRYTENTVDDYKENVERQLTEDVLKAAFHFRNRKDKYNESSLHDLEPLVEACIDAIDDCIFFNGNSFDVDYGPKYLILRSGLQFMIEDFKSMQEELSDVSSELSESVEFFDERLKSWKNNFGKIGFFENITHTAEELRRPEGLPAHHFWWFELDF